MKFAILSSTNASVAKAVYFLTDRHQFNIDLMICDRECGALEFAENNGVPVLRVLGYSGEDISSKILRSLIHYSIDFVYVFFTRLLRGHILSAYSGRLINFHPSILPACPGLHGFEDTIASGALLAGSTAHLIDSGMDTGKMLLQSVTTTVGRDAAEVRHEIFAQQCAALFEIHTRILKTGSPDVDAYIKTSALQNGFSPSVGQDALDLYERVLHDGPHALRT